jgi:hypothetical protein
LLKLIRNGGFKNSGWDDDRVKAHLRVRVLVPAACSFAGIGLQQWLAVERTGLGVVLDVSLNGAKSMSAGSMNPRDQLAIRLRLPDQTATMNVDATVPGLKRPSVSWRDLRSLSQII